MKVVAGPEPAAPLLPDLPLRSVLMGATPGVDFGQAGKRAVRFSYALNEESPTKSWQDPALASCQRSQQVRFRCSVFVNARELRS